MIATIEVYYKRVYNIPQWLLPIYSPLILYYLYRPKQAYYTPIRPIATRFALPILHAKTAELFFATKNIIAHIRPYCNEEIEIML